MPGENNGTGEVRPGLPIDDGAGLNLNRSQDQQQQSAQGPAEEVMTLEEFKQKYGHVKVRVPIAGEEVVEPAADALRYRQEYGGKEKTINRHLQEAARVAEENRRQFASLQAKPAAEPVITDDDLTDPVKFMRYHQQEFYKTAIEPQLKQVSQQIAGVVQALEPKIAESSQEKARQILQENGYDAADFEERRSRMIAIFEQKLGRQIQPRELAQVPHSAWAQAYLLDYGKNPGGKTTNENVERAEQSKAKIVRSPTNETTSNPRGSDMTRLINTAKQTGDWREVIQRRIKPAP